MGNHPAIITRAEALERGLTRYFTGKPCKRGHIAVRYLSAGCGVCSECKKLIGAKWRKNNPEKHAEWGKDNPEARRAISQAYCDRHPDRRRKSQMDWIGRNRKKHRVYQRALKKRRRQTDPDYRLRCNLRGRIHKAIRRGDGLKSGRTLDLIGCTVAELRVHLERQFGAGMTWENYGHGPERWNIDHRIPCASFDLTDSAQQRACFHFSNLQPMWHPENVRKGARRLDSDAAAVL